MREREPRTYGTYKYETYEAKEEEKFKSDSPFLDRRGNGSGYFPTTCSRHQLAPCYDPVFILLLRVSAG